MMTKNTEQDRSQTTRLRRTLHWLRSKIITSVALCCILVTLYSISHFGPRFYSGRYISDTLQFPLPSAHSDLGLNPADLPWSKVRPDVLLCTHHSLLTAARSTQAVLCPMYHATMGCNVRDSKYHWTGLGQVMKTLQSQSPSCDSQRRSTSQMHDMEELWSSILVGRSSCSGFICTISHVVNF